MGNFAISGAIVATYSTLIFSNTKHKPHKCAPLPPFVCGYLAHFCKTFWLPGLICWNGVLYLKYTKLPNMGNEIIVIIQLTILIVLIILLVVFYQILLLLNKTRSVQSLTRPQSSCTISSSLRSSLNMIFLFFIKLLSMIQSKLHVWPPLISDCLP